MALEQLVILLLACGYSSSVMELERTSFKVWKQNQYTSQKNHMKLQFKTTHATGLIFFAHGANKKDFLSVELYRGKIRVAANHGRGPENSLRPISGLYEMFLGKDLADNKWHSVEFIRNVRENILFIDRGTNQEKRSFTKSPPTYTELSISRVTFGGFFAFDPSEIGRRQSLSRKGFQGCFSVATFSQTWPQVIASRQLDFMSNGHYGFHGWKEYQVFGDIKDSCPDMIPKYAPMFFPSSAVHIALKEIYKRDRIKISVMFRTVISDQTLANYTAEKTGERIQFRISRKGRLSLNLDMKAKTHLVETSKGDYHDGEWHSSSFEIDNELSADSHYIAKFSVDGKTRLSTMSSRFDFSGMVNIGFGFTGCMREVKVNDQPIDRVPISESEPDKFFKIQDIGVIHNSCSLKDYCNPNPCQHGGKCNQTEDNVVCDCVDTLYEGSTCHRARFNYTCAGVRMSGERRSDVYYIDFDGMGPMEPVRALCDLGRTVETTTTQINNTKYNDIDVTSKTGRNTIALSYAANIVQMRELILNSVYCTQEIKFTCKGAPLFQSPEGPPQTSWMGGDDIMHYYWGGAHNQRGYCACGLTQTCRNIKKYCNCDDLDAYNNVWDEGNFTIKEHLPVREVKFEKVLRGDMLQARLRVGHLRCTGFGSRLNAATFRKPWSFLSVDHADQPFDKIPAGGVSFDFKTSQAFNYMVVLHAYGPFSGDTLKVVIMSTTLMRVFFNTGFGAFKQDVDITPTGRVLNDNQWHVFNLMFNMKELNVTIDGVEKIQGLPLQEDPFQFNVDGKPVYVGGSYYDKHGFVGCIRSLYINGRIHDLGGIAEGMGMEETGVYPGCGSACMLLPKACNYGYCVDFYDSFKCNCSVSPNDGIYCGNESFPMQFSSGQYVTYNLPQGNIVEPVAEAIMTIGFKTTSENVALGQVTGQHNRHFSVALVGGFLTLMYSTKKRVVTSVGAFVDRDTEILQITKRKLNDGKHNILRLRFSTEEIFLTAVNYDLEIGRNFTQRFIDPNNKNKGMRQDVFGNIKHFTVGKIANENGLIAFGGAEVPQFFTGCMSGAKLALIHHATADIKVRTSEEINIFKLIDEEGSNSQNPNPSGTFPSNGERCGPSYPQPGVLPTVGPATQFFTKSPGLDDSVDVVAIDTANQVILLVVILVVAVALLAILYIIYKKVNVNRKTYNRTKKPKDKMPPQDKEVLIKDGMYAKVNKLDNVPSGSGVKQPEPDYGYGDYL